MMFCAAGAWAQSMTDAFTGGQAASSLSQTASSIGGSGQSVSADSTSPPDAATTLQTARALMAYTSADYAVTPGDMYSLVFLRSATADSVAVVIDTAYNANLGVFGIVSAKGQTFQQFKAKVERMVASAYPGSSPQLLITATGVFKVMRRGEVVQAGEYGAWGLTRLSEVVAASRTSYASTRQVSVTSADGTVHVYDLFKADRDGDLSQNPYLKPADVVTLVRYERSVTITGRVRRPGTYQLLPGEDLAALIDVYGDGLAERADSNHIEVQRIIGGASEIGQKYFIAYVPGTVFALSDHDSVIVNGLEQLLPVAWFDGAISTDRNAVSLDASSHVPYTFTPGERLSSAVQKMRGALSPSAALEEAYLLRDGTRIPVDLRLYLFEKNFAKDYELAPNDVVVIPFKQLFVTVAGAVQAPGRYPYIVDRSWEYYIGLAGGFDQDKNARSAIDIRDRDNRLRPLSATIQPEDIITAHYNSFLYQFGRVSTVVTTALSVTSIILTLLTLTK